MAFRCIGNGKGGKVTPWQPYYYSYPPIINMLGMSPFITELNEGRIDIDDFSEKVKDKDCKQSSINLRRIRLEGLIHEDTKRN
jgi:aspartate/methionine/tyrosine aminotransferase